MKNETHNTAATKRQPALRARRQLCELEAGDAEWPDIRAAQSAYLAIVRADALAKCEARWTIPASKTSDTVHAIERAEEAMVAARAHNALLLADDDTPRADLCDARAAEELAELLYDLAIAKNREAFGGPERDAAALQLYLDTTVQPLVDEENSHDQA